MFNTNFFIVKNEKDQKRLNLLKECRKTGEEEYNKKILERLGIKNSNLDMFYLKDCLRLFLKKYGVMDIYIMKDLKGNTEIKIDTEKGVSFKERVLNFEKDKAQVLFNILNKY